MVLSLFSLSLLLLLPGIYKLAVTMETRHTNSTADRKCDQNHKWRQRGSRTHALAFPLQHGYSSLQHKRVATAVFASAASQTFVLNCDFTSLTFIKLILYEILLL